MIVSVLGSQFDRFARLARTGKRDFAPPSRPAVEPVQAPEATQASTPKPRPGTRVRLALRGYSAWQFAPGTWRVAADVINTPSWCDDPDAFAIYVDDGSVVKVRIIRMRDVHSIDGERVHYKSTAKKRAPSRDEWIVKGSTGDEYRVTRIGQAWGCTCAGYTFRQTCRHINETRFNYERS